MAPATRQIFLRRVEDEGPLPRPSSFLADEWREPAIRRPKVGAFPATMIEDGHKPYKLEGPYCRTIGFTLMAWGHRMAILSRVWPPENSPVPVHPLF